LRHYLKQKKNNLLEQLPREKFERLLINMSRHSGNFQSPLWVARQNNPCSRAAIILCRTTQRIEYIRTTSIRQSCCWFISFAASMHRLCAQTKEAIFGRIKQFWSLKRSIFTSANEHVCMQIQSSSNVQNALPIKIPRSNINKYG